jgi:hypothetical protein
MTYIFSRALLEAYSAVRCADTVLSAQLNSIRSVDLFLCDGKTTGTSRLSRFGMTFEHLTDDDGEALLTWYLEDSLAKMSVPPEIEPVSLAKNLVSGLRCSASFGRYDRSTSLWKTPPNLFGTGSTLSSKAWTQAGTMRNGVCWERTTWVRPISESDAGFWEGVPTPTVNGNHNRQGLSKTSGDGLAAFVKKQMWRTPIASQGRQDGILKKYATKPSPKTGRKDRQIKLSDQVGGKLNPEFVEWLMNFPIGFTDLKGLATPKCRSVPQPHGEFCMNESTKSEKSEEREEKRKTPMNESKKKTTSLLRCPRCNKQPKNHVDPTIGYAYGCCRFALLAKFSMFQKIAAERWNRLVLKYREKMDSERKSKKSNEL